MSSHDFQYFLGHKRRYPAFSDTHTKKNTFSCTFTCTFSLEPIQIPQHCTVSKLSRALNNDSCFMPVPKDPWRLGWKRGKFLDRWPFVGPQRDLWFVFWLQVLRRQLSWEHIFSHRSRNLCSGHPHGIQQPQPANFGAVHFIAQFGTSKSTAPWSSSEHLHSRRTRSGGHSRGSGSDGSAEGSSRWCDSTSKQRRTISSFAECD